MALRMLRSAEGGTHEPEFGPAAQSGLETTVARAVGVYPEGPASWDVEVSCPELQIYISFVAGYVHVTLSAINEGLTSRIGTNCTGGILAIVKGHLTGLYQHNHWSGVAVPTSVATWRNDDLLDYRFLCIVYLNNFLTLPLDFELKVNRIRKTSPGENGRA